jgi:cytochrome d ubiquinol oxidase subunit I
MIDPFSQFLDVPELTLRALSIWGITVHWIILQYSIGIWFVAISLEIISRWKKNEQYLKMAKVLSKVGVVIFAIGAATGTMSEFGLLLLWPNFLELVGKYFFAPLYIELFAFFAEVVFVYLYYYTWKKVGPRFHIFLGIMALIGLVGSGLFILGANSMMSYPPGINEVYDPATGEWVEPTFTYVLPDGGEATYSSSELRAMIENNPEEYDAMVLATLEARGVLWIGFKAPGAFNSFLHAIISAILSTIMTLIGVFAYRYRKVKEERKLYYSEGLKIFTIMGVIFFTLQGIVGHGMGANLGRFNPEKLAAMEGTSSSIFAIGDIPIIGPIIIDVTTFLAYGSIDGTQILSWDAIGEGFAPPLIIHYLYYLKMGLLSGLFLVLLLYGFYYFRKKQDPPKWLLIASYGSPVFIQSVSVLGWMVREIGRKPFTVYGQMTVDQAARETALPNSVVFGFSVYLLLISFGLLAFVRYYFRLKEDDLETKPDNKKEDES